METECIRCGSIFVAQRKTAKFCSDNCRVLYSQNKVSVKRDSVNELSVKAVSVKCHICNKSIQNPKAMQRYCSQTCRDKSVEKINEMLKARGLPGVIKGSDLPKIEYVSSGIKEVDELISGFPRRRITEIFGMKGVGKTSLMIRILNALPDMKIYYVDAEAALKDTPDNVEVLEEEILERVAEAVEVAIQSNFYDLIVIDSIAAMVPWAEMEGNAGDAHMGLKARLMSQWMRRVNHFLRKSNTALVFINQQRETMTPYGAAKFTPGGLALGYAASLRLELKSNKADKKETYQLVEAVVEKSRFSRPYLKTQFKLSYT